MMPTRQAEALVGSVSGFFAAVFPLVESVTEIAQATGAVAGAVLSVTMLAAYYRRRKVDKCETPEE